MNALGDKVPDPVEGKPLQITAQPLDGSGWQAESPNFAKCKHFLPATWPVRTPDPSALAGDGFAAAQAVCRDLDEVAADRP